MAGFRFIREQAERLILGRLAAAGEPADSVLRRQTAGRWPARLNLAGAGWVGKQRFWSRFGWAGKVGNPGFPCVCGADTGWPNTCRDNLTVPLGQSYGGRGQFGCASLATISGRRTSLRRPRYKLKGPDTARRPAFGPCVDGSPLARGFLSLAVRWLVRPCVRPMMRPCHAPLAIMPFARLRSRSLARTRGARPKWVFLIRRYQPALCISSCPPFPTSSTPTAPDL
jgi:hypothetical protein